jgi:predicted HicB family RNase H-like nuclease
MPKRTKKWEKDFEKRYSNAIKELQSLEAEHKQMREDNSDGYWFSLYPSESSIDFGACDNYDVTYVKENQYKESNSEHVSITLNSELGRFSFDFNSLKQLKAFRNDIIEECDKMSREDVSVSINTDECEEDDENWEDNEESEYTIQCSRTAVQTWTHTVMARSTCEAYRKAQEGEGHDENDDFDDYGDIDYESI